MVARREGEESKGRRIVLEWINAKDGRSTGKADVQGLSNDDPRLGPVVSDGGRVWALFGRGQNETEREVMQLVEQTR